VHGGPGVLRIVELIRAHCTNPEADVLRFVDAIVFNWLIGGIERHAKNYSFLIGPGSQVQLAPLYDPASVLHHRSVDPRNIKLAMQIGGEFSLRYIGMRNWQKLAVEAQIDDEFLVEHIREMAESLFDHALLIEHNLETEGNAHPTLRGLSGGLKARAAACQRLMH
jgi:serine/threonine-protein kinase HipA